MVYVTKPKAMNQRKETGRGMQGFLRWENQNESFTCIRLAENLKKYLNICAYICVYVFMCAYMHIGVYAGICTHVCECKQYIPICIHV